MANEEEEEARKMNAFKSKTISNEGMYAHTTSRKKITKNRKWRQRTKRNQTKPIQGMAHLQVAQQRLEIGHGQKGFGAAAAAAGARWLWNSVLGLH